MRIILILGGFLFIVGCQSSANENNGFLAGEYSRELLEQNLFLANDSVLIGLNNDKLSISKKGPFMQKSRVAVRVINNDGSREDIDFSIALLSPKTLKLNKGQNIYYADKKVAFAPNTQIRVAEYIEYNDIPPGEIWSTEIEYKPEVKANGLDRGTLFLGVNPKIIFMDHIKKEGIFFKTSGGLYLWILGDLIFFIRKKINGNKNKTMFHILTESNFSNLDFYFEHKLSNKLLLSSKYEVAEIRTSNDIFLHHIRIGEYVAENLENGNLWAQEVNMAEVKTNELLKFQGDIEERQAE